MVRKSDLLTEASTGPRRPGLMVFFAVLLLTAGGVFLAYKLLPLMRFGQSAAAPRSEALEEARRLEAQSLDRTAAERYASVIANTRAESQVRYEAALGLARLERDKLNDLAAAQSALEKAYLFAPNDDARTSVSEQLSALRGYPVQAQNPAKPGELAGTKTPGMNFQAVAKIGEETVTVNDLLFAWSQSYGNQPPTTAEFEPFVQRYLDMALLADEARRRGLEERGRTALELKFNRLLTLTKNLNALMMEKLPNPTEDQLREFYEANKEAWGKGPRARIGAFGMKDESKTKSVRDAIADGDDFEEIAKRYGGATAGKASGDGIGEIDAQTQTFELVGTVPGLAPFLLTLNDGQTTGPLQTADGYYWFKVLKKLPPAPPPEFEQVREDAVLRYQTLQLAQARDALLRDLRAKRPILLNEEALRGTAGAAAARTTETQHQSNLPAEPQGSGNNNLKSP